MSRKVKVISTPTALRPSLYSWAACCSFRAFRRPENVSAVAILFLGITLLLFAQGMGLTGAASHGGWFIFVIVFAVFIGGIL